jgi:hypothetical protein
VFVSRSFGDAGTFWEKSQSRIGNICVISPHEERISYRVQMVVKLSFSLDQNIGS